MSTPVLPKIEIDATSQKYGRYTIGPLEGGYGITLGNALRRVLLSSLPGAAVTSVRISDVHHEFSTIPNAREDVTQFILQVKQLRLKMDGEGPIRMVLRAPAAGVLTAGDIVAPPEVEILNPDLYLLTVEGGADLEIEFTVEQGRGYVSVESRGRMPIGELPVDAIFSPVKRVSFQVDHARVGQMTNYDRLTLEVWTDGRMAPMDAVKQAARILVTHLRLIAGLALEEEPEEAEEEASGIPRQVYDIPIERLDLSVRVFNSLKRTGITSVGEVLEMLTRGEDALLTIRNFGDKSLTELKERLEERGYLTPEEV